MESSFWDFARCKIGFATELHLLELGVVGSVPAVVWKFGVKGELSRLGRSQSDVRLSTTVSSSFLFSFRLRSCDCEDASEL